MPSRCLAAVVRSPRSSAAAARENASIASRVRAASSLAAFADGAATQQQIAIAMPSRRQAPPRWHGANLGAPRDGRDAELSAPGIEATNRLRGCRPRRRKLCLLRLELRRGGIYSLQFFVDVEL